MPVAPPADSAPSRSALPPAHTLPPATALPPATEPLTDIAARRMGPVRRFFHRHPVAMDVVVAAWFGIPALAVLLWGSPFLSGGERLALAALDAVAVVALLRRRQQPVLALGVILVTLAVATWAMKSTSGLEIAAIFALYAVGAYRPPTVAWLSLAGYNAVHASAIALWASAAVTLYDDAGTEVSLSDQEAFLIATSTMLALSVIALALGTAARNRRLHIETLVGRTRQLALERDQREQIALTAERNRIAREMHDVVAHSLSVMVALADGASASLEKRPAQARLALDELAATGRSALSDTRRLLGVLREDDGGPAGSGSTAPLTPQPASPDLAELIGRFQATGLPVTLTASGPPLPADAGVQLAVFRIVQEALTNVLRHAPGSPRIEVTLERHATFVVVEVDNADGAATPAPAGGRGLVGMRERAAVYDGHVEAGPTPGGWRVRAVLRWTEDELR